MIKLKDLLAEITPFKKAMENPRTGMTHGFNHRLVVKKLVRHRLGDRINIIRVEQVTTPKVGAGARGQMGDKEHRARKSVKYDIYVDEKYATTEVGLARAKKAAVRMLDNYRFKDTK